MKRPLRNVLALVMGDAGTRIIGFVVTVYLARVLEPSSFGVINIGLAVLGYLLLAASPGIQVVELRNVAAAPEVDTGRVGSVLSLRLALAFALLLGTWLMASLFVSDADTRDVVILYSCSLLPLALSLDWFFMGKEDFPTVSGSRVAGAFAYGFGAMALVRTASDLRATPVAFAAGNLLAAGILMAVARRQYGVIMLRWQPGAWLEILKTNLPVGLAAFLGQNVVNLPPLVISLVLSTAAVGYFSAAMKLIFVLLLLDRVVNAMLLPVFARYFSARPSEVPRLLTVVTKSVACCALPIGVLCAAYSGPLTGLVFGGSYSEAAPLLSVLAGYFVITLLSSVCVATLLGARKERQYTMIMVISSAFLVVLVVLLTLFSGATGAAWGVAGGELTAFLFLAKEVKSVTGVNVMTLLLKPALATVIMIIPLLILLRSGLSIPAGIIGVVVFITGVFLTRTLRSEEINFLKERLV